MDDRETIILVEALKGILQDIQIKEKRGVAIGRYLYDETKHEIKIPVMLWRILIYLNREIENEKLCYKSYNCKGCIIGTCEKCWFENGLVFAMTVDDEPINITSDSDYKIECDGERVSRTTFQLCAVFLRGCLYKYDTRCECYVPEEFYKWGMFVFFLYSFDAFLTCFKDCMKNGNNSLDQVFCEILCLIFNLKELTSREFMERLQNYNSEGAKFVRVVLRNYAAMGDAGYEVLNSCISDFAIAMKKERKEIINLLNNNKERVIGIFGRRQMKNILSNLEKDWFLS